MTPLIIFTVAFFAILTITLAAIMVYRDLTRPEVSLSASEIPLRRPYTPPLAAPRPGLLNKLDFRFSRLVYDARLGIDPTVASLVVIGCGLILGGVVLVVFDQPLAAMVGAVIGVLVGIAAIAIRRGRRIRSIQNELPNAIDAIARAVHAGESLEDAIELVAGQTAGELGRELSWSAKQLRLGTPIDFTMRSLADRIPVLDIRLLATIFTVHRRTGGNLASTLEGLSQVCRQRLDYRRQMRATTSAGRLSAWLVGSAGPILFFVLFFLFPDHIGGLFQRDWGPILVAIGVILEVLGLIWISRLLRVGE